MRFGLFVHKAGGSVAGIELAQQWPTMLKVAHAADAGPWESIWVYDHLPVRCPATK
jgi:hypothetical protein